MGIKPRGLGIAGPGAPGWLPTFPTLPTWTSRGSCHRSPNQERRQSPSGYKISSSPLAETPTTPGIFSVDAVSQRSQRLESACRVYVCKLDQPGGLASGNVRKKWPAVLSLPGMALEERSLSCPWQPDGAVGEREGHPQRAVLRGPKRPTGAGLLTQEPNMHCSQ